MLAEPRFVTPKERFLGSAAEAAPGGIALVGVPYDGTASFRKGARLGPAAIREASDALETYSPDLDADLEDGLPFADLGDLELPEGPPGLVAGIVSRAAFDLAERGIRPLLLGGEHSVTAGAVGSCAALNQGLLVVQLDAN